MSQELNEARRRVVELRTTLKQTEADTSDVRFALSGGGGASALATSLGVAQQGVRTVSDDLRALQNLKPQLAARIEQLETSIGAAQTKVVELEATEPGRQAAQLKTVKAALKVLPRFARAGLEADQSLKAFIAANHEMRAAAQEMRNLGHQIANPENMRVAFRRVLDTALSQIGGENVRSPGSSSFDLLTASWAENARLRLEALIHTPNDPAEAT